MRAPLFTATLLAICTVSGCFANSIIVSPTVSQSSLSMLQLEEELFGLDPADPYSAAALQSQLFTTSANAALYSNMLALITTLGGNQAMISQLFQTGAVFAGQTNPYSTSAASVASAQVLSQPAAPEPATIGLFGGGLLFLCCYAFWRKQINGPIQRTDKA